ncbi:hypothetical protein, partial [uncultured Dialister sp.]|uniref:hypothetical protein n=1 Tax=uncultured Dialister sp. TaxID=278064 RepID=UPI00265DAE4F
TRVRYGFLSVQLNYTIRQEKILLSMAKIMELLLKMGPNLVLHRKMIMFFGHLEIMNGILS